MEAKGPQLGSALASATNVMKDSESVSKVDDPIGMVNSNAGNVESIICQPNLPRFELSKFIRLL